MLRLKASASYDTRSLSCAYGVDKMGPLVEQVQSLTQNLVVVDAAGHRIALQVAMLFSLCQMGHARVLGVGK